MAQEIPRIFARHIWEVQGFVEHIRNLRTDREKLQQFEPMLQSLQPESRWLFTFCCWFSLKNTKWRKVEASRFYTFRWCREDVEATFEEFLHIIRYHEKYKWTPRRENKLSKFIKRCDRPHKMFFFSLIEQSFLKGLPKKEVLECIDIDSIDSNEIYRIPEPLLAKIEDLAYPIVIRPANFPRLELVWIMKGKTGNPHFWRITETGALYKTSVDKKIVTDINRSNLTTYVIVGFVQKGKMFPIDFFVTKEEAMLAKKGITDGVTPLKERIRSLNSFLSSNLLTNLDSSTLAVADNESEVIFAIRDVISSSPGVPIAVGDGATLRTGKCRTVTCKESFGLIDSVWVEDGYAKGINFWFNAIKRRGTFDFSGKLNTYLANPDLMYGKVVTFDIFTLGGTPYFICKRIATDIKPWRIQPLRGTDMWIEKCVLCGSTQHPHRNRGVCFCCEATATPYYWKTKGFNVWIKPSPTFKKKREATCWEPSLLNAVRAIYRKAVLVAREDGYWMMKSEGTENVDESNYGECESAER